MALGGKGVISVFSNALPGKMHELAAAMLRGDLETARKLDLEYLDLMDGFFMDVTPFPSRRPCSRWEFSRQITAACL